MDTPPPELIARIERIAAEKAVAFTRTQGGYTPAERWVVRFSDGTSIFAKMGVSDLTDTFLRDEYAVYEKLREPFMPRCLGWEGDGHPLLLLEDLSHAFWPPPWTTGRIDAVLATLEQMHALSPRLPTFAEAHEHDFRNWKEIAADPEPFLGLDIATADWLETALPILLEAESAIDPSGNALTHFDIRSDNICITPDRAILIDWNWGSLGNPQLDLGFWLPSLTAEGGPPPESILPDAAPIAAAVSGFFAARAGLPQVPLAPHVRWIQKVQLETALPWAVRALDLPSLSSEVDR